MPLTQNPRTPLRIIVLASLLFAFAAQATASEPCKPKIDKKNIVVELAVENLTQGKPIFVTVPVNSKEQISGGNTAPATVRYTRVGASTAGSMPASYSYTLNVSDRRDDGSTIDLYVEVRNANGSIRTLKRSIFVPHQEIKEFQFLGGVRVKAYYKLLPFHCKSI